MTRAMAAIHLTTPTALTATRTRSMAPTLDLQCMGIHNSSRHIHTNSHRSPASLTISLSRGNSMVAHRIIPRIHLHENPSLDRLSEVESRLEAAEAISQICLGHLEMGRKVDT
jgi:hypothetical protein